MDVVLLGAGGHAKDTIKNIEEYNSEVSAKKILNIVGCLDDVNKIKNGAEILGYPVLSSFDILTKKPFKGIRVICAVGDPVAKKKLVAKAKTRRLRFFTFIHPSVAIHRSTKIGEGVNIFSSSVISAACSIGDHVSINYACSINHDCTISEFATISPGVRLGGKCSIGAYVFLGINACTVHGITLGDWSVLGAGATAIKDIANCTIAVGSPSQPINKRDKNRAIL